MDARTFEDAKKCYEYINMLYAMLIKLDSLADVTNVKLTDSKTESFELSGRGPIVDQFHDFIRTTILSELKEAKELMEGLVPSKASIIQAIETSFKVKNERNWDKIYYVFDVHGTIVRPNYEKDNICKEFYPYAKEVLEILSKRDDIVMIMYTCSHPYEIDQYVEYFKSNNIIFDYINENPEIKDSEYGCFDKKPYMNVLLDDKSGFNAETDWIAIHLFLLENKMVPTNNEGDEKIE